MFGNVSAWSCLLSVAHGEIENLQLCFSVLKLVTFVYLKLNPDEP